MSEIISVEDFNLFERLKVDVSNLGSERNELLKFTDKVNLFFEKESIQIVDQCIRNIINSLKSIDAKFLGDDFEHLTLFEQISHVVYEDELDHYWAVKDMIHNYCKAELDNLNEHDHFIFTNRHRKYDEAVYEPLEELESRFIAYATDFTSDNLSEYR